MTGLLHFILWLLLAPVFLFLLVNGGLRLAAHTGAGILLARNGQPYIVRLSHWLPQLIGRLRGAPIYAITIGRTICVTGDNCWPALHAHEWKHVEQDERYRGLENELYYLRALLTGHGYSADHWAEAEATRFAAVHASEFQHLYAFPVPPLVPA